MAAMSVPDIVDAWPIPPSGVFDSSGNQYFPKAEIYIMMGTRLARYPDKKVILRFVKRMHDIAVFL